MLTLKENKITLKIDVVNDKNQVKSKKIVVATGNKNVFSFYERYGFQHKYDVMYIK